MHLFLLIAAEGFMAGTTVAHPMYLDHVEMTRPQRRAVDCLATVQLLSVKRATQMQIFSWAEMMWFKMNHEVFIHYTKLVMIPVRKRGFQGR